MCIPSVGFPTGREEIAQLKTMYGTQYTPAGIESVGKEIPSPMKVLRFGVVAGLIAALVAVFGDVAFAQSGPSSAFDLCGGTLQGQTFVAFISALINLIVIASVVLGTLAIVLGFAAESAPFLDASMKDYKKKGLIYGWGIVVFLYFLNFFGTIVGINVSCLFPI